MTEALDERMAALNAHETRFIFESFDHAAAWQLGTQMVERALAEVLPVIIDIRRPGLVLFRSALAGTTAENEAWLNRKANTVFRYETAPRWWPHGSRLRASTHGQQSGSTPPHSRRPAVRSRCASGEPGSLRP